MARQARSRARSRKEPRRSSAWRRRGQIEGKPSAVAVGPARQGLQDAQEEAVGQPDSQPPAAREALESYGQVIEKRPVRRRASAEESNRGDGFGRQANYQDLVAALDDNAGHDRADVRGPQRS